jgi:hypothetical protein
VSADRVEKATKKGKATKKQPRPKSKSPSPPTRGHNSGPLDVIIYNPRPREGNIPHWSFFVENNAAGRGIIRDVVGRPGRFERNRADNVLPENSGLYRERIQVGDIDDVRAFEDVLDSQPILNDVAHWSCQDYIMEALVELKDQDVIQEHDYDDAVQELTGRFDRARSSESEEY